jgi:hypothetical protein
VPALQPYIIEPIFEQFEALLPEHRTNHSLGCHRPRVPDRVVFGKLVEVLVFGCAYWRIADEWIEAGLKETLRGISLEAYDHLVGLELADLAVDGCIIKALAAGRKRQGARWIGERRRQTLDSGVRKGRPYGACHHPGQPSRFAAVGRDLQCLGATQRAAGASVNLDRAYDSVTTRCKLAARCLVGEIPEKGKPAPLKAGKR